MPDVDPLPPDLPRLRTLETYLEVQLQLVRERIARLEQPQQPGWRLVPRRAPAGQPRHAVLHRGDCWMQGGHALTRREAELALDEDAVEACDICHPEEELQTRERPNPQ